MLMQMVGIVKQIEVAERRVDFLVEGEVFAELKALARLEEVRPAQGLNYLVTFGLDAGLLIIFDSGKLQFKRLMKQSRQPHQ